MAPFITDGRNFQVLQSVLGLTENRILSQGYELPLDVFQLSGVSS
jgi:hypothetical protein